MGSNSIVSNLDCKSIISTLRLALGADIERKLTFLIVEGEDDSKFLRKFCSNSVTIYESYSGKEGVHEIISNCFICDNRVIGIRDRDYFEGKLHDRIFFYDKSCMEMMIISFNDIFECVYHEHYFGSTKSLDLKKKIFRNLEDISIFRMYNEICSIGINFKGLSMSNILNDDMEVHFVKLIEELQKLNSGKGFDFESIYKSAKEYFMRLKKLEYYDIINGHDFIQLFREYCNKANFRRGINDKTISSSMRTSFKSDSITETRLYKDVSNYSTNFKINVWSMLTTD